MFLTIRTHRAATHKKLLRERKSSPRGKSRPARYQPERLNSPSKLFADETRCPVLDPGRGKTKTGYLWALTRDDRPWGGTDPPAVAYTYAPGRGGEHALPCRSTATWLTSS